MKGKGLLLRTRVVRSQNKGKRGGEGVAEITEVSEMDKYDKLCLERDKRSRARPTLQ